MDESPLPFTSAGELLKEGRDPVGLEGFYFIHTGSDWCFLPSLSRREGLASLGRGPSRCEGGRGPI